MAKNKGNKKITNKNELGEDLFGEDYAPNVKQYTKKQMRKAEKIVFGHVLNDGNKGLPKDRDALIDHYEAQIRQLWNQQYESSNAQIEAHEEEINEMYNHIGKFFVERQNMWDLAEKDARYINKIYNTFRDAFDSAGEPIQFPIRGE